MAGNIESLEGVLEPIDFTVKKRKTRISDQKLVYQGLPDAEYRIMIGLSVRGRGSSDN
jgi:hypothetical protein